MPVLDFDGGACPCLCVLLPSERKSCVPLHRIRSLCEILSSPVEVLEAVNDLFYISKDGSVQFPRRPSKYYDITKIRHVQAYLVRVLCYPQGGKLLWIAPSGGRDRPNAEGTWMPAAFDPSSVDLMRTLLAQAKRPGHMFPLAMHSGEMMPPPPELQIGLGERRLTSFVGVGVCPILHLERVCVYNQHMHRWGHVAAQAVRRLSAGILVFF